MTKALFQGYLWQRNLLKDLIPRILNPSDSIVGLLARRQVMHKSASLLIALLEVMNQVRYKTLGFGSPTYRQAERQFLEIKKWADLCHLPLKFNGSELTVTNTITHSVLKFQSLGIKDNVRGDTFFCYVIDEAAFIPDESISLILPMLDVEHGTLILASTPWKKTGMFWNLLQDDKTIVYDWTHYDLSQVVSEERLEFYRRTLSPALFKTEILGEFLDSGESVLYGDISSCIRKVPYNNEPLYVGIDASVGKNDYCALSAWFRKDDVWCELETIRFRNDDADSNVNTFLSWLTQHPNITVVNFETNSVGKPLYQSLKKRLSQSHPRTASCLREDYWSAKSKGEAVANSVLLFNSHAIAIHTEKLISECCAYTQTISSSGTISFGNDSHKEFHDDMWCSALHALSSKLSSGVYNVL